MNIKSKDVIPTFQAQPFFSIVIPTFNRSEFLLKAIDSIMVQEFREFEVIVVDDGSTDETSERVSELIQRHPFLKYFYKQNEERSIARNYGIQQATGKYITFLDSDDFLYSNHLSNAFKLIHQQSFPEVCQLGFEIITPAGQVLLQRNDFDSSYQKKMIHENIMHGNGIFIRKDIAQQIQFIPSRDAVISEDWYLWLRLVVRYPVHFDNTVTSAIVHHAKRSLLNINADQLAASIKVIIEYLKKDAVFLQTYGRKARFHFANHYTHLTLILALTKSRRVEAIKYLFFAMRYDPTVVFRRRFLASVKHILR